MRNTILLFLLFWGISCSSPEQQLNRLEHDLIYKHPKPETFLIKTSTDTLQLPIPQAHSEATLAFIARCKQRAQAIPAATLPVIQQKKLFYLLFALDSLHRSYGQIIHPQKYALGVLPLRICLPEKGVQNAALFIALLEKIPAYYDLVESRWIKPQLADLPGAIATAQSALDALNMLEKTPEGLNTAQKTAFINLLPAAKAALKNYIGLCQSGYLL